MTHNGLMAVLLLVMMASNVLLSLGLIVFALRSRRSSGLQRARVLSSALAVAGGALLVTVAARLGARLVTVGVLPQSFKWLFETWWYLVVSALTSVLLVGGVWLAARLIARLGEVELALATLVEQLPHEAKGSTADLTPREREVLTVMAAGSLSDGDIAAELFISPRTSATHVRNIMKKTDLHNRRELMLLGRHLLAAVGGQDPVRARRDRTGA